VARPAPLAAVALILPSHGSPPPPQVEGAENEALADGFPFAKYTFGLITIERPPPPLNQRLFSNGYLFVKNHAFDTFYVHSSHPRASDLHANATFVQLPPKCNANRRRVVSVNGSVVCEWSDYNSTRNSTVRRVQKKAQHRATAARASSNWLASGVRWLHSFLG
jgi:hypothetical protein